MNTTELRLGNYVFNNENRNDKTIYVVDQITSSRYNIIDIMLQDGEVITSEYGTEDGFFEMYPAGIKLDKPTLELMGFIADENGFLLYKNSELKMNGTFLLFKDIVIKQVKYVHELQNLVFALTGNELTIETV